MPTTTKKTTPTAPLALPQFRPVENKFASAVARNARLASLLPAAEIGPLVAAFHRAEKLAEQARALRAEFVDPASELHAAVESGDDVDVVAFVSKVTAARAAQAGQEEALRVLSALPARYKQEIARVIEDAQDDLLADLDEQLTEVLDEAEVVLKDLAGATDAESALLADKGTAYRRWLALADTYAEIRAAQLAALTSVPNSTMNRHSPQLAAAMFGNAEPFMPQRPAEGVRYGGIIRQDSPPVDLLDTSSRSHFEWVVAHRAEVRPHVGNGESTGSIPLDAGVVMAPRHLSPRDRHAIVMAKNEAAQNIADQRDALI